jgi:hypothetical protein
MMSLSVRDGGGFGFCCSLCHHACPRAAFEHGFLPGLCGSATSYIAVGQVTAIPKCNNLTNRWHRDSGSPVVQPTTDKVDVRKEPRYTLFDGCSASRDVPRQRCAEITD